MLPALPLMAEVVPWGQQVAGEPVDLDLVALGCRMVGESERRPRSGCRAADLADGRYAGPLRIRCGRTCTHVALGARAREWHR